MKILRIINAAIVFFIFGLSSLLFSVTIFPLLHIMLRDADKRRLVLVGIIQKSFGVLVLLMSVLWLIKVEISEKERYYLARARGMLIVANHPSFLDVVILIALVRHPVCIAKGKLLNNMFVRKIIKNAYIANEGDINALIEQSSLALREQYNLIIFPEGTRTDTNAESIGTLRRGAAHIAIASGADVLPVRITLNPPMLRKGKGWYDVNEKRAVYSLTVGAPVRTSSFADEVASANHNARRLTGELKNRLAL